MRTKKTNIKTGKITRTIPFTMVKYLSVDIDTREVTESEHIFTLEYDAKEAENALREIGVSVAAVISVETYEQKFSISYENMVRYGNIED